MATEKELSDFLANIERRAFKQMVYAVRREEVALDIVQDAMIKLVERYADKSPAELPVLFQRILQTTLMDHFRREKIHNARFGQLSGVSTDSAPEDEPDWLDLILTDDDAAQAECGARQLERAQVLKIIEEELQKLSERQRAAFLLRFWEDMNVADTAAAMGCTEGSVKTHCSRAIHALAVALKARGVSL